MPIKGQIRILGIDDSPFAFSDETVQVVGVVVRAPGYIEGVMRTDVGVDGSDATRALIELINRSKFKSQLKAVMTDGIAMGGFNVLDIDAMHSATGLPVITITREEPDLEAMASVLKEKFDDWEERLKLIERRPLTKLDTGHKPIFIEHVGIELDDVKELVEKSTVRGALPEPIRVAHLIASGIKLGESKGRA